MPSRSFPVRMARRLFWMGFLSLFLELALIRYLAGNIWNLGYFPNLVLLGVFIGMGTGFVCHGFLSEAAGLRVFAAAPPSLLALVILMRVLHPALPGFGPRSGEVGGEWFLTATGTTGSTGYGSFVIWLGAVVVIFAMLSQYTAKLFAGFQPLRAYTLDIGGSCCGILCFMLMSWLRVPAGAWFLATILLFVMAAPAITWKPNMLAVVALAVAAGVAFRQDTELLREPDYGGRLEVTWSPYQKVELRETPKPPVIFVNGIMHQAMRGRESLERTFYQVPYGDRRRRDLPPYERVLILGAGAGNDSASALLNGVRHVDAVEIDPVVAELGRRYHPEHPYQDSRVSLTVGDARAFLTNATDSYDLIVFALIDSRVKVSPMAQLRLENYVFTQEAIRRAYTLLADNGSLAFYDYFPHPWLRSKLVDNMRAATGAEPRTLRLSDMMAVVILDRAPGGPSAMTRVSSRASVDDIDLATDDWPFPYLRQRGIPAVYLAAMAIVLVYVALLIIIVQRAPRRHAAGTPASVTTDVAFALMGAAFLLLETKSVVQFALLFGTTWLNNSLVFLAVLVLVLAANWIAHVIHGRWLLWVTFPALIAASLTTLVFPLSELLYVHDSFLRFGAASLLAFSPVFFANLLFSATFRDQPVAEQLFGWNLFGATIGGVLEYGSMAVGYNALGVIVAACYAAAFALLLKDRAAGLLGVAPGGSKNVRP